MATPHYTSEQIAQMGKDWFEREIRAKVEPHHHGEIAVINVETGEFEIAPDHLTAARRARTKFPTAPLFAVRIGFPALARIGGRAPVRRA